MGVTEDEFRDLINAIPVDPAQVRRDRARHAAQYRRHPFKVTADRLGEHLDKIGDKLSPVDRVHLVRVRYILQQLADGEEP